MSRGVKTVIYSCPFIPPEWIAAHGLHPSRIMPPSTTPTPDLKVSFRVCPYARAFIQEVVSRRDIVGAIFTTRCDQMRRGSELVQDQTQIPIFLFNMPATCQTTESLNLYQSELIRLGHFLVRLGGKASTEKRLVNVMLCYDRHRRSICNLREIGPARLFPEALAQFHQTGTLEPPAAQTELALAKIRLALIGGPLTRDDFTLFDLVEKAGGKIVLDGSETGERTLPANFDRRQIQQNPFTELAETYFNTIPDVFRRPNSLLYQWFQNKLSHLNIQGIIFRRYVWCDQWAAEFSRFKEWAGLPVLDLDVGENEPSTETRTATRIQAFLEMLR